MASVPFQFVPPDDPDLVKLYILESATQLGGYVPIETVLNIGQYPNYITEYTTDLAANPLDWFAIQWEDNKGAKSEMSAPIQGGQGTLVGEVIRRVRERDRSIDVAVAVQEAEAVIEKYLNVDPYAIYNPIEHTYTQLNGLTYMVLARALLVRTLRSGEVQSATIGLVTMRADSSSASIKNIEALMDLANDLLGVSCSLVMLLEEVQIGGSTGSVVFLDESRLMLEIEVQ